MMASHEAFLCVSARALQKIFVAHQRYRHEIHEGLDARCIVKIRMGHLPEFIFNLENWVCHAHPQ
jgi:hypothetical protein